MRALSNQDLETWCNTHGIQTTGRRLRFPEGAPSAIMLTWPKEPNRLPYLPLCLFDFDIDSPTEHLLWVRDWDTDTDLMVEAGVSQFHRLRQSYRVHETLREMPATLMETTEVSGIIALSTVPLLFGWDAYFVSAKRNHLGYVSHDGYACVLSRSREAQASYVERIRQWEPVVEDMPLGL
jgi:hypothetical protein